MANLLLRGLADPRTPEQTAQILIEQGEFSAVENLRSDARLSAAVIRKLNRRLEMARQDMIGQINDRVTELHDRADHAGIKLALDVEELTTLATERSAIALDVLAAHEHVVKSAEDVCAQELSSRADAMLAEFADDGTAWRAAVAACIKSKEFPTVRELLEAGPSVLPKDGPLSIQRPRVGKPFLAFTLPTVLNWYDDGHMAPVPRFEVWQPPAADSAAWAILTALRCLTEGIDAHSVLRFVMALHELVGDRSPRCEITPRAHGVLTTLRVPPDDPLPRTPLTGPHGIAVWVAHSSDLPPEKAPRPLLWFVPAIEPTGFAPWGVARLSAGDLLRLLAPGPEADLARYRRINLLRAVMSRLPARDITDPVHRAIGNDLMWFFDLAGVRPDEACLYAIRHDTAGQPLLLRRLLAALMEDPPPGQPRRQRLSVSALDRVRHDEKWRRDALAALLRPLGNDDAARAVIRIAAAFYSDADSTFTAEDLQSDVALLADGQTDAIELGVLRAAANRLVADQLLRDLPPSVFQLPATRVRELLIQAGPTETTAEAQKAIRHLRQPHIGTFRAEIVDRIVRTVGHSVDGRLRGIQTELSRIGKTLPEDKRIERADRYAQDASGLHRMYREALGSAEACDLNEVLLECSALTEWITAGAVTASVHGAEDVLVMANRWLLRQAFTNLFDNARLEIEGSGNKVGRITVRLQTYREPPPSVKPEAGKGAWCVTELEDDGPGLDDGTREGLTGGGRHSMQLRRQGTGVAMARQWFAEYGGYLDIGREPSQMGGARILIWLPQHTP
jgi:signal transduction histidine kinase